MVGCRRRRAPVRRGGCVRHGAGRAGAGPLRVCRRAACPGGDSAARTGDDHLLPGRPVQRQGHAPRTARAARSRRVRGGEMRTGEIESSLFAATDAAGIPDNIAIQIADIFAGDIDFHRDLRRGDRFAVVFETLYHGGPATRSGRVLAAEFSSQKKIYRAVWFQDPWGRGGYYTPEGTNLRKAFLRSPLEFSRVTSGFGMRRHPIFQQWRAHQGIDYGAPAGTRVKATGNGVVAFSGRRSG